MKIKIIDILNKIANGEKPPKKIIYDSKLWEYDNQKEDYFTNYYDVAEWLFDEYVLLDILNDGVEILQMTIHNLETKKNNIIEKLKEINFGEYIEFANLDEIRADIVRNREKINEIIDYIQE